jgi:V/A-type H+-transporting ATPase subunit A
MRHFPAINWLTSYSLYLDEMEKWFNEEIDQDWMALRGKMMRILSEESSLNEMVQLVGMDALSAPDRLTMETARSIREDYLHQDAFHEIDTYTPLHKQFLMMKLILSYDDLCRKALEEGAAIDDLVALPVREHIGRFKYTAEAELEEQFDKISHELNQEISKAAARKEDF